MKVKMNDESYDYYTNKFGWHQKDVVKYGEKEKKSKRLTKAIKDRVIDLLFVTDEKCSVSDEARKELHDYMDVRFKQCHSLALYITDKERGKKPEERSKFAVLCDSLGLDPGHKQVQVTSKLQVLYSDDYAVPRQPR